MANDATLVRSESPAASSLSWIVCFRTLMTPVSPALCPRLPVVTSEPMGAQDVQDPHDVRIVPTFIQHHPVQGAASGYRSTCPILELGSSLVEDWGLSVQRPGVNVEAVEGLEQQVAELRSILALTQLKLSELVGRL
ncbi:hypothetical protein DL770_011587 [Monosporascus sp. CRB-9-2]|nr:hypothetical protein DL770_011587 [Monosporascus sp. CRB-9-2]